jgi:hypothetical protein
MDPDLAWFARSGLLMRLRRRVVFQIKAWPDHGATAAGT